MDAFNAVDYVANGFAEAKKRTLSFDQYHVERKGAVYNTNQVLNS